jgi:hypothetical protein
MLSVLFDVADAAGTFPDSYRSRSAARPQKQVQRHAGQPIAPVLEPLSNASLSLTGNEQE